MSKKDSLPILQNVPKPLSVSINTNGDVKVLSENGKIVKDCDSLESNPCPQDGPKDGGWGWIVCAASFWTNGIIFGILNCFGLLYVPLKNKLEEEHEEASFLTSWIGSASIGMTFLLSPLASILTDKCGVRKTALIGGLFATLGMALSSVVSRVELLYLTFGVVMGLGSSLAYTPSLVILGQYFKRWLGVVNGIVTTGSPIFTIVLPFFLQYLLKNVGLTSTLQVLAGLQALVMVAALVFRPVPPPMSSNYDKPPSYSSLENVRHNSKKEKCIALCEKVINKNIWKNKRYVLWVTAFPIALFGYFVPYVHLVQHVKDVLPESKGEVLVTCLGISSLVSRLLVGIISDCIKVNRIYIQQLAFFFIGILTMLLVVAKTFESLVVICLCIGFCDGCFVTLLGPIAFDIVGPEGASQAIGFLLGLCSIPLTLGPPVAGLLYDKMGNYTLAFCLAGVPPLVGTGLMCMIPKKGKEDNEDTKNVVEKREIAALLPNPNQESSEVQHLNKEEVENRKNGSVEIGKEASTGI